MLLAGLHKLSNFCIRSDFTYMEQVLTKRYSLAEGYQLRFCKRHLFASALHDASSAAWQICGNCGLGTCYANADSSGGSLAAQHR